MDMKGCFVLLLVLAQLLLLCSCDAFGKPAETTGETEAATESATVGNTDVTTEAPTEETAPATMGHAPELSDEDMPSADWSEGTNQ
jgi:hypothetical protein